MNKQNNLFNLKNKNIVIIGACGLIGKALVNAFVKVDANIAIVDIPQQFPKNFAKSFNKTKNIIGYPCDISNKNEVQNLVFSVLGNFSTVDVLINSAQYKPEGFLTSSIEGFEIDLWNDIIRVNLTGTFITCQAFGTQMIKQKKGSIINFASTYGVVSSNPGLYDDNSMGNPVAYTASKGAVIMLTKYLAVHWAKKGVRVNCLTPHGVYNDHEQNFINHFSQLSPMGRMMKKEELVGAAIFLASDAASYVTGENLMVDGGWTAW